MSKTEKGENIKLDESDGWYRGYRGIKQHKKHRTQKNYRLWQRLNENFSILSSYYGASQGSKDGKHGNQWSAENRPIMLPGYCCTQFQTKLNSRLRIITHINARLDKDHMSGAQWPFLLPTLFASKWIESGGMSDSEGFVQSYQSGDGFDHLTGSKTQTYTNTNARL